MNFWPDFIKLKTAVGGNREQVRFEDTFGMPREEQQRITMPNNSIKRILSELEFCIRLTEDRNGEFDECVNEALSFLCAEMAAEGTLTKTVCMKAEQMLMPCAPAAKEYKLILAGHAHIDMDWMWSYQETVAISLSTFRTVLNLMKQYPEFCFSQSQTSVYQMVEEYDPRLMEEMKKFIQEGRFEITASAWVETDKNMPNTESLLRHIQYTKHYLEEKWGIDPDGLEIDFSPDTFGHSANMPEINAFGGVKYLYHCRGLDGDNSLYRWRAPSGKEMLCYREQYWYNSAITPKVGLGIIDVSKTCGGFKTGLVVYGVGDHGGGPTRRDIEAAIDMQSWPVWPVMKFGTFREFFHEAEAVRDQLPLIDREMNYVSSGCYTTQTRIKRGNRKSEATLTDAEALMAFAQVTTGKTYPKAKHEQAWQNVLYTHFHDVLTGSCVQDSRENAMGQFGKALAYAQSQYGISTIDLAAAIDTSGIAVDSEIALTQAEGAGGGFNMSAGTGMPVPMGGAFNIGFNNGVPNPERGCGKVRIFNIFNPTTVARKCVTELTVWDWVGDMRRIQVKDVAGNELRYQLLDAQLERYWDHMFFRILVEAEVPAMGYTTVVMSEAEATSYKLYRKGERRTEGSHDNFVLENELVRAEFHRVTGGMISFIDKETGTEYIQPGNCAHLSVVNMETRSNSAWSIGKYMHVEPMTSPITTGWPKMGALQQSFTAEYKWGKSTMKVTPILQAGEKAIRFCVYVDWHETFGETTPLLTFDVPLAFNTQKFLCDIPGGAIYRNPMNHDIPGLQYCAAIKDDGSALALVSDSKYGYRASEDQLAISLINTSKNPDPYPDRGIHYINLSLVIGKDCPKALEDTATTFNHPTYFMSNNAHKGTLPTTMSFLELDAQTTVLSALLPTEDVNVVNARFYETAGKDDKVTLKFGKTPTAAVSVDLNGREVESDVAVNGNEVSVSVKANCIGEVKVTF